MKERLVMMTFSMTMLTGCGMENRINQSTCEIRHNTAAVERSTEAIERNLVELEMIRQNE